MILIQTLSVQSQDIERDTLLANEWLREGNSLLQNNQIQQAGDKFNQSALIYKGHNIWDLYDKSILNIIEVQQKLYSFQPTEDLFTINQLELDKLELKEPLLLARILHHHAKSKNFLRQFENCKSDATKAIELKQKHDPSDTTMIADIIQVKSYACYYLGEVKNAAKFAEEALELEEAYSNAQPLSISNSYNNLSGMYARLYELDKALECAKKSLAIRTANLHKNHKSFGDCYNNISMIYSMMGDYDNALLNFKNLISLNSSLFDKTHITNINTFKNKASLLASMGYDQRSIEVLDYILSEQDMSTFINHIEYPNILLNYGLSLKAIGKHKDAVDTLLKAFNLASKIENFQQLAKLESSLGLAYLKIDKTEEAITRIKSSIVRQNEFSPNSPVLGDLYGNLGLAYKKAGRYIEAKENLLIGLHNSIKILPKGHHTILNKHNYYIELLNLEKEYKKVIDYYVIPEEINSGEIPDLLTFYSLKLNSGVHHLDNDTNNLMVADSCYSWITKGIDKIQLSKLKYLTQKERFIYQEKIFSFCENALDFIYTHGREKDKMNWAFKIIEESKGFALLQNLRLKSTIYPKEIPREIIDQELNQRNRIKYLELKISQSFNDSTVLAEDRLTLVNYRETYSKLTEEITREYPKFSSMKFGPKNSSLDEVSNLLKENEANISYFDGQDYIYYLCATQDKALLERSAKNKDWNTITNAYRKTNTRFQNLKTEGTIEEEFDNTLTCSNKIYNIILKDVIKRLPTKVDALTIIPDGDLNFISFESLIENDKNSNTRDYRKLSYLLNRFNISYAPSSTIWVESKYIKNENDKNYVGFGPSYNDTESIYEDDLSANPSFLIALRDGLADLPYARKSVENSSILFKGDSYLAKEANKVNFLNHNSSAAILHLAMHGIVDHENPMNSKLVFTKDSQDSTSYWLNASEIYNLQLDNQLSVLTACNTGVGKLKRGEGVMSLSRAFGYAGSPSLMMSLWSVPDVQTSEITKMFFENLKNGDAKNAALRKAKLQYLKNTPRSTAHPMFWSGFTISGNMDPIVFHNSGKNWIYLLALAALGLVLFSVFNKRKSQSR